ncbi:hypothetical protein GCM10010885_17970 [Alicyclobacillus cellulosilyticus]|uniref:Sporulation protein YqfC n=1 Tax=Alicyclobacillus cellulosilyticus TaxID=1003997 RepID=A0A917KCT1_9BACL|nr:YabP/YqfC family sporulation protein [Alicyclobacillus cellulosilyticus]GGJ09300.1 hypothetical protein GCM10010885_17970 [Alicyclobacillus cellulosilyticus]
MTSGWKRRIRRRAAQWLNLPPDALLGVSRLTVIGGRDVVVENVRELRRVSTDEVEMALDHAAVRLCGAHFTVTFIAAREVHVHGELTTIEYRRSEEEPG